MAIRYRTELIDFRGTTRYPASGRALPVSDRHASTFALKSKMKPLLFVGPAAFAIFCQGCGMLGSLLFDPNVKAAFSNPRSLTEIEAIKNDPAAYSGHYLAVTGIVTEVSETTLVIDGYLTVSRESHPQSYFASVKAEDRITARGKFFPNRFSGKRPELRYARNDVANTAAQTKASPPSGL